MKTKLCGCSDETCGCCAGTQALTPAATANRPGLDALAYRVGTHGAFLETMKARIATMVADGFAADGQTPMALRPLQKLNTRDAGDPSIALLDGWATVADVLTFYQERIANEAYLRTASERRSVLELARLVGYKLRPGVAASVYLAYTLDDKQITPVEIAAGARSQSIPGPDELPQSFETAEPLLARAEWSNLLARRTAPQRITADTVQTLDTLYFAGTETGLKPNDPLLFDGFAQPVLRHVESVEADFANQRSKVSLVALQPAAAPAAPAPAPAVMMAAMVEGKPSADETPIDASAISVLRRLVKPLSIAPALPAARSSAALSRNLRDTFGADSDVQVQILGVFNPAIKTTMYGAWASGAQVPASGIQVFGFAVKAAPFGSNAALKPVLSDGKIVGYEEWTVPGDASITVALVDTASSVGPEWTIQIKGVWNGHDFESNRYHMVPAYPFPLNVDQGWGELEGDFFRGVTLRCNFSDGLVQVIAFRRLASGELEVSSDGMTVSAALGETKTDADDAARKLGVSYKSEKTIEIQVSVQNSRLLALEAGFDQIVPGGIALVIRGNRPPLITDVKAASTFNRAEYWTTGKSTQLTLGDAWRDASTETTLAAMRNTTVYAQSRLLVLADEPVTADVAGDSIELDRLCDGLKSGRWIIVSGERADIATADSKVAGVTASELVMIAGVKQGYDAELPGDKVHTTLQLANKLAYRYKRETVKIFGNVVKATHGETRRETLGSGDGARPLPSFALKQPPLTFVAAGTPSGVSSTLKLYVNDIEWHEEDTLALLGPRDRGFVTKTGDDDVTSVIFGNGEQGARLPTGVENVKAVYRNGIGKPGNVRAGQISLLQTRPLGVKEVINPLRASGGADRESLDLARESTPLAVMALDRLVSVQDYADFARTFAGIGKAASRRLSDGRRELVHVTIAGADDIPVDPQSDLFLNLGAALRRFGDPALPVQVNVRELIVLLLSANVRLAPDYLWDPVAARIRVKLLAAFGFGRRALAQPVALGQIIGLIQNVEGVAYVDVDTFGGLPEKVSYADGSRHLPSQEAIRKLLAESGGRLRSFGVSNRQLSAEKKVKPPSPWVDAKAADFDNGTIRPAQLAIFVPAVPDTLILNQIG
jgi:predicted phage baseplate assembly protein